MVRGRRRIYHEPVVLTIKTERELHDIALYLKLSDTEVYNRGIMAFIEEKMGELSEKSIHQYIQNEREKMKGNQDRIALAERVAMDAHIRDELRNRQKKETRIWDGQEVIVGVAE